MWLFKREEGSILNLVKVSQLIALSKQVTTRKQTPNRRKKISQGHTGRLQINTWYPMERFADLKSIRTYNEIELLVQEHGEDLLQHKVIEYTGRESIVTSKSKIDAHALSCTPSDIPSSMYPIETAADGNCFPRTLSKLIFGTKEYHQKSRLEIWYPWVVCAYPMPNTWYAMRLDNVICHGVWHHRQVVIFGDLCTIRRYLRHGWVIASYRTLCGMWSLTHALDTSLC